MLEHDRGRPPDDFPQAPKATDCAQHAELGPSDRLNLFAYCDAATCSAGCTMAAGW